MSRLILKCLEKDKQARYADVRELREELEKIERGVPTTARIIPPEKPATSKEITVTFKLKRILVPSIVVIGAFIIGIAGYWLLFRKEPIAPAPEKPSLAVLPFEDLSPQKDQDWFCNGITEEIINRLSNIRELKVPARTSSFSFKGKQQDVREIGKTLGVATVLEGSIQRIETKLRARVQLIRIADGDYLWSAEFDRDVKDVFAIQDEIALAVVDKLKLTLWGDEKTRLAKHQAIDPAACEEYLKGRNCWWQWSEEGAKDALGHFSRAIEIKPNCAPAHAGMALAYIAGSGWMQIWSPREGVPKGIEIAQKAIQLDPALADGYVAMALARMNFDWDWAGAEMYLKKALELNPNSVWALDLYTSFLGIQGHFDEAVKMQASRASERWSGRSGPTNEGRRGTMQVRLSHVPVHCVAEVYNDLILVKGALTLKLRFMNFTCHGTISRLWRLSPKFWLTDDAAFFSIICSGFQFRNGLDARSSGSAT